MKTTIMRHRGVGILIGGWAIGLAAFAAGPPAGATRDLSAEALRDKIRGGLRGQLLGNLNGIPHEFRLNYTRVFLSPNSRRRRAARAGRGRRLKTAGSETAALATPWRKRTQRT